MRTTSVQHSEHTLMYRDRYPRVHGINLHSGDTRKPADFTQEPIHADGIDDKSSKYLSGTRNETNKTLRMRTWIKSRLLKIISIFVLVSIAYYLFRVRDGLAMGLDLPKLEVLGGQRESFGGKKGFKPTHEENAAALPDQLGKKRDEIAKSRSINSLRNVACVPLKSTEGNAKICVHNPNVDKIISTSLIQTGTWDEETVHDFKLALESDRRLGVIDIGANLGTYSLLAAYMGRKVLALEACHSTVQHLQKSVQLNSFDDRIAIIEAAVMAESGYARVAIPDGEISSAYPTSIGINIPSREEIESHSIVKAVTLDDLVEYVKVPDVILKVDIGGEEYSILQHAKRLFQTRRVKYVFMVFSPEKGTQEGKKIGSKFLTEQGYFLTKSFQEKEMFLGEKDDDDRHPSHLVWMKQKF